MEKSEDGGMSLLEILELEGADKALSLMEWSEKLNIKATENLDKIMKAVGDFQQVASSLNPSTSDIKEVKELLKKIANKKDEGGDPAEKKKLDSAMATLKEQLAQKEDTVESLKKKMKELADYCSYLQNGVRDMKHGIMFHDDYDRFIVMRDREGWGINYRG